MITLTASSCAGQKRELKSKKSNKTITDTLVITKIDSTTSYYIIYASKKEDLYKIISRKAVKQNRLETLEIGKSYLLSLKHYIQQNNNPLTGYSSSDPCFFLDDKTEICREKDVFGPYTSEDLKGLYYVKNH